MCNTGKTERIIRAVVGIMIIAWGVLNSSWLGAIGIIPLGTALVGFCPLYALFGIDTRCKIDQKSE